MSFDHVWLRNVDDDSRWADLYCRQLDESTRKELESDAERLIASGHFVTLSAGGNYCHDEQFLFETSEDAEDFFEWGFRSWECFMDSELIGCGFQEVALYTSGSLVSAKSVPPTMRSEASDEGLSSHVHQHFSLEPGRGKPD